MDKEKRYAAISTATGVIIGCLGSFVPSVYWSSFCANIAVGLLGLGAGLFLINFYLNREAKKEAVFSLMTLVAPSIEQHHNDLLEEAWGTFGRPQWGEMIDRYISNNGDPTSFTPEERDKIYAMIKAKKEFYIDRLRKLETDLRELVLILGWTFDPSILAHCFNSRYSILKFSTSSFDDSTETKKAVIEHFLDAEITSNQVHSGLVRLLGWKEKDIYGD